MDSEYIYRFFLYLRKHHYAAFGGITIPYIEGRKNGALLMMLIWLTVPAVCVVYFGMYEFDAFILITVLMSAMYILIGAFVYLGYTGMLAGINTMSPEELKKYDLNKISSYTGKVFAVMAYAAFFATLAALMLFGSTAAFAALFIVGLGMPIYLVIRLNGKEFKTGR